MSIRSIGKIQAWHGVVMIGLIALVGCEEGQGFLKPADKDKVATDSSVSQTVPKAAKGEARDVEAPEVFQVTSSGLWDGRPSLGGIWVAHPDVTQPERVIIRNTKNSKSVVGALFRRERNNPGPVFQISSDAADALGMLAGAPAELSVTALRKEAPPPPPPTPEPVPEVEKTGAETKSATTTKKSATEKKPTKSQSKKLKKAEKIETKSLAPVAGAAAAIAAAEVANAAAASSGGVTDIGESAQQSSLRKPYLQIGTFSVKENAESTAAKLREQSLQASVREQKTQSKTLWRVVVGPATNKPERSALLKKIKGIGFDDAYPVRD
ncbi:SPOR domain-containing protein [Roseovarius sp. EL26]|uniref:SPOR domain-containing protein n=1 Tax=Roseovarius sp. EL26 TaxID=2126672 RepID=UPI000EA2B582|nr:SPOR domain-containing protein [Roseovarius sp. EL26]